MIGVHPSAWAQGSGDHGSLAAASWLLIGRLDMTNAGLVSVMTDPSLLFPLAFASYRLISAVGHTPSAALPRRHATSSSHNINSFDSHSALPYS